MRSTNPRGFLLLWGIMTRYLARMDFKAYFPPLRNRLIIYYILVEKSDSENCWKCHFYVFSSHFKHFCWKNVFFNATLRFEMRIPKDWTRLIWPLGGQIVSLRHQTILMEDLGHFRPLQCNAHTVYRKAKANDSIIKLRDIIFSEVLYDLIWGTKRLLVKYWSRKTTILSDTV